MSTGTFGGIRAIVLDLDDTLYLERDFAFSGFDAVAAAFEARLGPPAESAAEMRRFFEDGDRGHIFDHLLERRRADDRGQLVPEMMEAYRNHRPDISLAPDADAALTRWTGRYRLALVSDGPPVMQQRKIDVLGLEDRLDLIVLTGRWGVEYWKPHPRAFEHVQEQFDLPPTACLYAADNPVKDFIAPNRLGWNTVRVRREEGIHAKVAPDTLAAAPQMTVRDLGILAKLLESSGASL